MGLLALAQAARMFGLLFMYESIERYAFVPTIMGLVLMVAGWQVFRRLFLIMMFMFLMFPLPGRVHNMVSGPLQGMATTGAVFLLEAFGVNAGQQGNVINMNGAAPLAVAEACSGLRLLTAFVVVAAFIAYMIKRSIRQKLIVLVSSIPVAVICNIVRIFLTACFMLLVDGEFAETFFHDFAGLVMMPIAVLLIFGELWLMDLLVAVESQKPLNSAASEGGIVRRRRV
jgi:exosortase